MEEKGQRLELGLNRQPHGLDDVHDAGTARAWAMEIVQGLFIQAGRGGSVVRLLGEKLEEAAVLEGVVELGDEALLAALVRELSRREGTVRCFRHDEVLLGAPGEPKPRRHAVILEVLLPWPDDEAELRWWLATRPVGTGAAGVGVFHGDWQQSEGTGLDDLPEELHEWVDASRAALTTGLNQSEYTPRDGSEVDLRLAVLDPPPQLPPTAMDLAVGVTLTVLGAIQFEDGETCRAIHTFAEVAADPGHRARRMLALQVGEGGRLAPYKEGREQLDVPEGEGWIGVAPESDVTLSVLGMVGSDDMGRA